MLPGELIFVLLHTVYQIESIHSMAEFDSLVVQTKVDWEYKKRLLPKAVLVHNRFDFQST
jgi:hypothetical protein